MTEGRLTFPKTAPPRPPLPFGLGWLGGQGLALVPLLVGLVFGAVMLPRSVPPRDLPLPLVDGRAFATAVAADDARAARIENGKALPSVVRAVGTALRAFNTAEANHEEQAVIGGAKNDIDRAVRDTTDHDYEDLLDLRAVEMKRFLSEALRYEQTGALSDELKALGGTFVDRMTKVGWCENHRLAMPEPVRRVAFKLTWNRSVLLDRDPRFAATLDENRVLYAFYLTHPHPAEDQRALLQASVVSARDPAACVRAEEAEERATASWLLGKIGELARLDPAYPVELAKGAALFMRRDYLAAASVYEAWLQDHRGGPWTLRVQNHLKAAIAAEESER